MESKHANATRLYLIITVHDTILLVFFEFLYPDLNDILVLQFCSLLSSTPRGPGGIWVLLQWNMKVIVGYGMEFATIHMYLVE